MSVATVYEQATGRILRVVSGPSDEFVLMQAREGEALLLGVSSDNETQYVENGALAHKQPLPVLSANTVAADGVTVVSVSGLPNPTHVAISGPAVDTFTVEDGTLELTFDVPGRYVVFLDGGARHLRSRSEIDAT